MEKYLSSIFFAVLISLFSFKASIEINNIEFKNEVITIYNQYQHEYYYHLILSPEKDIPEYLQISIAQEESGNYVDKFFIFYYQQDSTFTDVKQISKVEEQLSGTTYPNMWLNKNQIKNGFYFKIQDDCKQLKYKVIITPSDYCELNLDFHSYTYYVTNENQEMTFWINEEKKIESKELNYTLLIWIDSQKEIKYDLNIKDYIKHSKYNTFIIKPKENQKYILKINASIGDEINVGFMNIYRNNDSFTKKDYNIVKQKILIPIGTIYKGFLKRGVLEQICFKEDSQKYFKFPDIGNKTLNVISKDYRYECLNLPENIDEIYFICHYSWYFGQPLSINSPDYYSLLTGITYSYQFPKKIYYGFMPLSLDTDFNYLTYHISINEGDKVKVYITDCNDYPSCNRDFIDLKNAIQLNPYFNSFTYSISKSELDNEYLSPISHKKKILIFKFLECEEYLCPININIYTDKTKLIKRLDKPFYKYLNKNNSDNILVLPKDLHDIIYGNRFPFINVEILSGNISLTTNKKLNAKYKNSYLYNLSSIDDTFDIKINANTDSLYSIKLYYFINKTNNYYNRLGESYLLNIDKNNFGNLNFLSRNDAFVKIQPIKGNIADLHLIEQYHTLGIKTNFFYQHFSYKGGYPYPLLPINLNSSTLLYCMGYDSKFPIILKNNMEEYFVFNKKNIELNFVLYSVDNNLNLEIIFLNNGNFIFNLSINDKKYYNDMHLYSSEIVAINFNNLENIPINKKINKISFNLKSVDITNDSFIKIIANQNKN